MLRAKIEAFVGELQMFCTGIDADIRELKQTIEAPPLPVSGCFDAGTSSLVDHIGKKLHDAERDLGCLQQLSGLFPKADSSVCLSFENLLESCSSLYQWNQNIINQLVQALSERGYAIQAPPGNLQLSEKQPSEQSSLRQVDSQQLKRFPTNEPSANSYSPVASTTNELPPTPSLEDFGLSSSRSKPPPVPFPVYVPGCTSEETDAECHREDKLTQSSCETSMLPLMELVTPEELEEGKVSEFLLQQVSFQQLNQCIVVLNELVTDRQLPPTGPQIECPDLSEADVFQALGTINQGSLLKTVLLMLVQLGRLRTVTTGGTQFWRVN